MRFFITQNNIYPSAVNIVSINRMGLELTTLCDLASRSVQLCSS